MSQAIPSLLLAMVYRGLLPLLLGFLVVFNCDSAFAISVTSQIGVNVTVGSLSPATPTSICKSAVYPSINPQETVNTIAQVKSILKTEVFEIESYRYTSNSNDLTICFNNKAVDNSAKKWVSLAVDLFMFFTFHFVMVSISRIFFVGL